MHVIPAVDVLDGEVVRLNRGRFDEATRYSSDALAQVDAFAAQGAPLVHVVDLAGARSGRSTAKLWESLLVSDVRIQAGGGVRSAATASRLVDAGVSRVVVGTAAFDPRGPLDEMLSAVGTDRLVVALDVRDGRVRGSGWTDEGAPLAQIVDQLSVAGVSRVLVTQIERDGTLAGPDVALLDRVRNLAPGLAIVASGGVGSLEDVALLGTGDWEAVVVGKALYERRFTYAEAAKTAQAALGI